MLSLSTSLYTDRQVVVVAECRYELETSPEGNKRARFASVYCAHGFEWKELRTLCLDNDRARARISTSFANGPA